MWTTVVLLGLTVSLEPTRLGLIALLLTRPRPIRHLIVFQCTGLTISLTVGLTVLFIFHRSFLGNSDVNPALLQIALGVALLLLAGVLASSIPLNRFSRQPKEKVAAGAVGASKSDLRAMLDGRNGRRLPTDVAAVIARRVGAGVYRDRIITAIRALFDIADPPENDRDYVHRLEGAMLRFGSLGEAELAKCRREARR